MIWRGVFAGVLDIVGEVTGGTAEASAEFRRLEPALVVIDVDLDAVDAIGVCADLTREQPQSSILVLTDSYQATKYHNQLMRAGVRGLCLKSSQADTLFAAVEQLVQATEYRDPKICQIVKQDKKAAAAADCDLNEIELAIIVRLHLTDEEIAKELDISGDAIEKYMVGILAKLKVSTRTAAALRAVQLGLAELPYENAEQH